MSKRAKRNKVFSGFRPAYCFSQTRRNKNKTGTKTGFKEQSMICSFCVWLLTILPATSYIFRDTIIPRPHSRVSENPSSASRRVMSKGIGFSRLATSPSDADSCNGIPSDSLSPLPVHKELDEKLPPKSNVDVFSPETIAILSVYFVQVCVSSE